MASAALPGHRMAPQSALEAALARVRDVDGRGGRATLPLSRRGSPPSAAPARPGRAQATALPPGQVVVRGRPPESTPIAEREEASLERDGTFAEPPRSPAQSPAASREVITRSQLAEFREQLMFVVQAVSTLEAERDAARRSSEEFRRRVEALEKERDGMREQMRQVALAGHRQVEELKAECEDAKRSADEWRLRAASSDVGEASPVASDVEVGERLEGQTELIRSVLAKKGDASVDEMRQAIGDISALLRKAMRELADRELTEHSRALAQGKSLESTQEAFVAEADAARVGDDRVPHGSLTDSASALRRRVQELQCRSARGRPNRSPSNSSVEASWRTGDSSRAATASPDGPPVFGSAMSKLAKRYQQAFN